MYMQAQPVMMVQQPVMMPMQAYPAQQPVQQQPQVIINN